MTWAEVEAEAREAMALSPGVGGDTPSASGFLGTPSHLAEALEAIRQAEATPDGSPVVHGSLQGEGGRRRATVASSAGTSGFGHGQPSESTARRSWSHEPPEREQGADGDRSPVRTAPAVTRPGQGETARSSFGGLSDDAEEDCTEQKVQTGGLRSGPPSTATINYSPNDRASSSRGGGAASTPGILQSPCPSTNSQYVSPGLTPTHPPYSHGAVSPLRVGLRERGVVASRSAGAGSPPPVVRLQGHWPAVASVPTSPGVPQRGGRPVIIQANRPQGPRNTEPIATRAGGSPVGSGLLAAMLSPSMEPRAVSSSGPLRPLPQWHGPAQGWSPVGSRSASPHFPVHSHPLQFECARARSPGALPTQLFPLGTWAGMSRAALSPPRSVSPTLQPPHVYPVWNQLAAPPWLANGSPRSSRVPTKVSL